MATTNSLGIRRLFLDLEVSPNLVLTWKAGYDIVISHDAIVKERKIICAAYRWDGEDKTYVLRWDKDQDDRQLLIKLCKVIEEADEIVGHFLDKFDWPWLKTRCLINHLPPPPPVRTIDTKMWASRNLYCNSNKLDYLAQVLGHGGKEKMEFEDWKLITLHNDKKALDKMCHYCGVDVEKLEKVYHDLAKYVKPKTHVGVLGGRERWTCPRTGSRNVSKSKTRVSAAGTVTHQMRNNADGTYFSISDTAYRQYLNR